jgi:hypothetical protein
MEEKNKKFQGFKPGEGGRPKGAKNKITRDIQERVEWMLELADERIEESIAKLRPKELVDLMVSLQEFVRPKLQRMNLDVGTPDEAVSKITFEVVRNKSEVRTSTALSDRNGKTEV